MIATTEEIKEFAKEDLAFTREVLSQMADDNKVEISKEFIFSVIESSYQMGFRKGEGHYIDGLLDSKRL